MKKKKTKKWEIGKTGIQASVDWSDSQKPVHGTMKSVVGENIFKKQMKGKK